MNRRMLQREAMRVAYTPLRTKISDPESMQ